MLIVINIDTVVIVLHAHNFYCQINVVKCCFCGVENSLSQCANDRKNKIIVLNERIMDGLDDTSITAEVKQSVNVIEPRKKICLSLHYNAASSFS